MGDSFLAVFFGLVAIALLAFLGLALYSSYFHLKYKVPFVPTPQRITDAMIDAAKLKPGELALDLGAGDGRVLARAMQRVPGIRAIGYEGSLGVWMLAKLRNAFSRFKPDMRMQNFFEISLSDADVIFTYLSIGTMKKLLPKFQKELKPGARVIAHAFSLRGLQADEVKEVQMPFFGTTQVFVYRWK